MCCSNSRNASITDVFSQYVDLIQTIRKSTIDQTEQTTNFHIYSGELTGSKNRPNQVLDRFSHLICETFKWKALSLVVNALKTLGCIFYLDTGLYESTYEFFEEK